MVHGEAPLRHDMLHSSSSLPCRPAKSSAGSIPHSSGDQRDDFHKWRPTYHFIAPNNWMNDPCGPCFDPKTGLYHLFYQYNFQGATWGNMSWMHATSKDLVSWKHVSLEPAIKPSTPFDCEGIFSGGILMQGPHGEREVMTAIYTAVSALPIHWTREYCWGSEKLALAVSSDDGKSWIRTSESLLLPSPPEELHGKVISWRDPYVAPWPEMDALLGSLSSNRPATDDSTFYGLISGGLRDQTPTAFLYRFNAKDVTKWDYIGTIADVGLNKELSVGKGWSGDMGRNWEVCNFFHLDDQQYLLMNVEGCGKDLKGRHAMWARCTMAKIVDDKGKVSCQATPISSAVLDHGCLYAATTFDDYHHNRRVLWGWITEDDLAEDRYEEQGWSGCMALPRQLFHTFFDNVVDTFSGTKVESMANYEILEGSLPGTKKLTMLSSEPVVETKLLRESSEHVALPAVELVSSQEVATSRLPLASRNWEMKCEIEIGEGTKQVGIMLSHNQDMSRNTKVVYEPHEERLNVYREQSSQDADVNTSTASAPFTLFRFASPESQEKKNVLETLKLHIFLDNSVLEIFANDRLALTTRIYLDEQEGGGDLVSFLVQGDKAKMVSGGQGWIGLKEAMQDASLQHHRPRQHQHQYHQHQHHHREDSSSSSSRL